MTWAFLLLTMELIFAMLAHMFSRRKFIATLFAAWLPLFSGYALADSITMQNMHGNCHDMQQAVPSMQHMHHAQLVADTHQSTGQQGSHSSSHSNCDMCKIACTGYLASLAINMPAVQLPAQSFPHFSTQFKSFISAPLDPPPLARV